MTPRTDTATRARRMVTLLPLLRKNERILLADLASALGCSAEEVAEDLTTLTMCGIPPFTPFEMIDLAIDGDSVVLYMEPPALREPLRLTQPEARALGAALEAAGFDASAPLRNKLAGAHAGSVLPEVIERTIRMGTAPGGLAVIYATLASAIEAHEKLRIEYYTGATGRVSVRVVQPWSLAQQLGSWYLVAWCENADARRVFRLDRIHAAETTGERFIRPPVFDANVTPSLGELPVAEVRFASGARLPDERAWPGATFTPQLDGTTLARVAYQSPQWVAREVVAQLGDAEVMSPPEVRDAVAELAAETLERMRL